MLKAFGIWWLCFTLALVWFSLSPRDKQSLSVMVYKSLGAATVGSGVVLIYVWLF